MQRIITFILVALLGSEAQAKDLSACALDGVAASSAAIHAGVHMWAANQRCSAAGLAKNQGKVLCTTDITGAIASVAGVANVIANAVDHCGQNDKDETKCAAAATGFVSAAAGLASAAAEATNACSTKRGTNPFPAGLTTIGECVADVDGATGGVFTASHLLRNVKDDCDDEDCAMNSLNVMGALAGLGSAVAASVDDCTAVDQKLHGAAATGGDDAADCAGAALGVVATLTDVARTAKAMADDCEVDDDARLYMQSKIEAPKSASNSLLVSLVPVAGIVIFIAGFLGGRKYQKTPSQTRDVEAYEVPEE